MHVPRVPGSKGMEVHPGVHLGSCESGQDLGEAAVHLWRQSSDLSVQWLHARVLRTKSLGNQRLICTRSERSLCFIDV